MLAPSRRRVENLRRAARDAVRPARRGAYLFAPFDVLRPGELARADWLDLDGVRRPPIDDAAFAGSVARTAEA